MKKTIIIIILAVLLAASLTFIFARPQLEKYKAEIRMEGVQDTVLSIQLGIASQGFTQIIIPETNQSIICMREEDLVR